MTENQIRDYFSRLEKKEIIGKVIGLTGNLGVGKTYLVKQMVGDISISMKNQVDSPTFSLCNIYQSEEIEVHHFDLYRIESEEELYDIGIWESIERSDILVFIEWIDFFKSLMKYADEVITITDTRQKRVYTLANERRLW